MYLLEVLMGKTLIRIWLFFRIKPHHLFKATLSRREIDELYAALGALLQKFRLETEQARLERIAKFRIGLRRAQIMDARGPRYRDEAIYLVKHPLALLFRLMAARLFKEPAELVDYQQYAWQILERRIRFSFFVVLVDSRHAAFEYPITALLLLVNIV